MKKFTLALLLACSVYANSQDKISISVFQDAKLLFIGDDKGNNAGTINMLYNMDFEGKQFKYYYFSIKTQYEHADLVGGNFKRYSVNLGWVFNQLMIPKLEAGVFIGVGIIHRGKPVKTAGLGSYNIMGELNYPILKRVSASVKLEIVRRSDLVVLYDSQKPFIPNVSIGLKFNVYELF